jgi:peptide/nickel transport system permease protein
VSEQPLIGQPPRDTPPGDPLLPDTLIEDELPSGDMDSLDVPVAQVYVAPQWKLVWWRFCKHRLALVSAAVLLGIYGVAACAEFFAPTTREASNSLYTYAPPQRLHFVDHGHLGLYVYAYKMTRDPVTLEQKFKVDKKHKIPLTLFGRGPSYTMWGLFKTNIHLIAPTPRDAPVYLLGANALGQDVLSRVIYGARISMSIGLVGVAISLVLGLFLGGLSGYYGGATDTLLQRLIEFLISIPTIPLWMGLAAAVPPTWSAVQTYFAITVILSVIGWTQLARVVRGRFLAMRQEDFVTAAVLDGASAKRVMWRHMMPLLSSHVIAATTLAVPTMILAETTLSFLGLGLQAPAVSWGVLLQEAQNIRAISTAPWLVIVPGVAVVIAVLAFNFVGDGLRDAADPYSR